ncbi:hypothetical protein [Geminicoccus roseus]|uniref:hypothetical protein n=1 Tax=Geminicoccus roseus TaxID=404900 RepID=UPI000403CDBB|nr:hypothetical protein [Geminicoccus roseus]
MATSIGVEKRLLTESEFELVVQTHYPQVTELGRSQLIEAAKRIRGFRDKAGDIVRQRRREHRGKSDQRGANPAPSEAGVSRKKQVFANALRRINNEIRRLGEEGKPGGQARIARRALAMKRAGRTRHHPDPGRTADAGMRSIPNEGDTVQVDPREVGRVSQFVKDAQAKRDS